MLAIDLFFTFHVSVGPVRNSAKQFIGRALLRGRPMPGLFQIIIARGIKPKALWRDLSRDVVVRWRIDKV